MKPNYDAMTNAELRAYILAHRDDLDAMEAFFSRRSPDSEAIWGFIHQKPKQSGNSRWKRFALFLNKTNKKQPIVVNALMRR